MRAFNASRAVRASGTEERAQPSCAALPQPKSGSAKPCPIAAQCPRSARWARAWRRKINFDVALQRLYAAKDGRADPSAGAERCGRAYLARSEPPATLRSQHTCRARPSIAQLKRQQVVLENRYAASPKGSLDFDEPGRALMALAGSAIVSIWLAVRRL